MFDGTCTVFNLIYDRDTRIDRLSEPAHLYGVHWEDCKAANVVKSGMRDADGVMVYIPIDVQCDKAYKTPKAFAENPVGAYTFRPGDMLVKGEVAYAGDIAGLTAAFDSACVITSVDLFDYGTLAHWEISGK